MNIVFAVLLSSASPVSDSASQQLLQHPELLKQITAHADPMLRCMPNAFQAIALPPDADKQGEEKILRDRLNAAGKKCGIDAEVLFATRVIEKAIPTLTESAAHDAAADWLFSLSFWSLTRKP